MWQYVMGFGLGMTLLFLIVPVLVVAFWVWMLVDCVTRRFKDKTDKIVWVLVIIFAHIIGALVYFFVVKRKD